MDKDPTCCNYNWVARVLQMTAITAKYILHRNTRGTYFALIFPFISYIYIIVDVHLLMATPMPIYVPIVATD
jgi:hypothetical protein